MKEIAPTRLETWISEHLHILIASWQVGLAVSCPCLLPELSSTYLTIRAQVYNISEIHYV